MQLQNFYNSINYMQKKSPMYDSPQLNKIHPFQYLTGLNTMYNSCNKTYNKTYTSTQNYQLAWQPFSIMKIPYCFQDTFNNSHKNDKDHKYELKENMEDNQKKIWKEHQQILKRYSKNNYETNRFIRPKTCTNRNKNKQIKQMGGQDNILIRRLIEKGANLTHNKNDVQKEVLQKLKNNDIQNNKKQISRVQSAKNCVKKQNQKRVIEQMKMNKGQFYFDQKPYNAKARKSIDQNQYLLFNRNSEIITNYKQKIKQVDCAISQLNIKKTAKILRNMENIVQRLQ